jgi:hypothetical protein
MGRPRKRQRDDKAPPQLPALQSFTETGDSSLWQPFDDDHSLQLLDPILVETTSTAQESNHIESAQSIPWSIDLIDYTATPVQFNSLSPAIGTCNCLVVVTSALQSLRAMTSFHFPSSMGYLRNVLNSLSSVVDCPLCPMERSTGLQNNMLMQTALMSITERFQALLMGLEQEYQRMEVENIRPQIRMGDPKVHLSMHTGTLDCPMGFTLTVDPIQWKELARKALMSLVRGPGPGENTLAEITARLETRQQGWHSDPRCEFLMPHAETGPSWPPVSNHEELPRCVANIRQLKKQVEMLV